MKSNTYSRNNSRSTGLSDKAQAYLHIHAHAMFSSLGRLFRNSFTTFMAITIMAIAISLAAGFYLLIANMQQFTGEIESSQQISLFLKTSVSDEAGKQLAKQLRKNTLLNDVTLISKKQALIDFKQYSGFGDALNVLDKNPLPVVLKVSPKDALKDISSIEKLITEFNQLPQVDFTQLDMQWIERLQSIMQFIQRGATLLSILLGIAVLFITGNTIRLELQNRRDEVLIAKLVGATHSFIQRPFLYTGFWLGFLSGVVAWILLNIMILVLQSPVENLSILYNSDFKILYLNATESILLLIIASCLGILGAWSVLHYQLQQIKPD